MSEQPAATASGRPLGIALAVGAVVLVLDQLTKMWAVASLGDGPCGADGAGCIQLIGSLRLHLVYNTGAAFSTGGGLGLGPVFGILAIAMSLFLLNMARQRTDVLGPVVLGAVAGGALGNVVDRLARSDGGFLDGAVVDFIDLQWWPVFNVADSAVVVGISLFVLLAMREDGPAEPAEGPGGDVGDDTPAGDGLADDTPAGDDGVTTGGRVSGDGGA